MLAPTCIWSLGIIITSPYSIFSSLVAMAEMVVNQREFGDTIHVNLIMVHNSAWQRSPPHTLGQKGLPHGTKGIETCKPSCINLADAWSIKVSFDYTSLTGVALFNWFGHWDLCLLCSWGFGPCFEIYIIVNFMSLISNYK